MFDQTGLKERIRARAHQIGFDLVGITGPDAPPHFDIYQRWIQAGRHAGMAYLARERALQRRADPRLILPACRSIIVTGTLYDPPYPDEVGEARVAAYARGDDYHHVIAGRMQALVEEIEAALGHPIKHRIYTDTGPLLERELAMRAGLGWIGKNTCLIHPQRGSYLLLAEMLTDLELPADPPFASDRCGTCSRCIEACPTGCILPDRTLDAGRCISYLTIEEKGAAPEPLRHQLQDWLFGCDICQEVCPWNQRFARPVGDPAFEPRALLESPRLEAFLRLEPGSWRDSLRGSPLERPRRRGLVRNAALVAGNTARADLLSILERILLEDPEPILREQAAWSIARIAGSGAGDLLQSALAREENEAVRLGILRALKRAAQA